MVKIVGIVVMVLICLMGIPAGATVFEYLSANSFEKGKLVNVTKNELPPSTIGYQITCNLNGGVSDTEYPKIYTLFSEDIKLANPVKGDFFFTGWTGSNGTTPQRNLVIKSGSAGNIELTANYEQALSSSNVDLSKYFGGDSVLNVRLRTPIPGNMFTAPYILLTFKVVIGDLQYTFVKGNDVNINPVLFLKVKNLTNGEFSNYNVEGVIDNKLKSLVFDIGSSKSVVFKADTTITSLLGSMLDACLLVHVPPTPTPSEPVTWFDGQLDISSLFCMKDINTGAVLSDVPVVKINMLYDNKI
ncbi:MAG: hypothetical protein RR247_01970 [Clostridia bacterium]